MTTNLKDRFLVFLKGIWRIAALILLLSLPTFSFFMPGFELSDLVDLAVPGGNDNAEDLNDGAGRESLDGGFPGSEASQAVGFTRSARLSPSGAGSVVIGNSRRQVSSASGRSGLNRGAGQGIISRGGSQEPGSDPGEGTAQEGSDQVSADLLESVLSDLESLDEVVKSLSSGFRSQGYSGAGSARSINPFLRSLANSNSDGDSGGDSGGGDSGGGDSGGGDSGGGDSGGGDSGGGSSGDDDQNMDPEDRFYDTLLIGTFTEDQESLLFRASHGDSDLRFYLDDGTSVDLFYSSTGNTPGIIVEYEEGELVLTSDFDDDGYDDLLVVNKEEFGDVVYCWARIGDNQMEEAFSGSFPYRTVSGLDFFDWDSDGVRELVVAFENTNNLFIYDINNGTLRYSREFTLPFEPSTLVSTQTTMPIKNDYLQVFNDALDQSVVFNARYQGVYSYMAPSTFVSSNLVELDMVEADESHCAFIGGEYKDRLVILRRENENFEIVLSLGLGNSQPTAAIFQNGESQEMKILLGF
jgi:hypothetical protein